MTPTPRAECAGELLKGECSLLLGAVHPQPPEKEHPLPSLAGWLREEGSPSFYSALCRYPELCLARFQCSVTARSMNELLAFTVLAKSRT